MMKRTYRVIKAKPYGQHLPVSGWVDEATASRLMGEWFRWVDRDQALYIESRRFGIKRVESSLIFGASDSVFVDDYGHHHPMGA